MTTNPSAAPIDTLPFLTVSSADKKIERRLFVNLAVAWVGMAAFVVAGFFVFSAAFNANPYLAMLIIPVITFGAVAIMTLGIRHFGNAYRTQVVNPHLEAARAWFIKRYGLNTPLDETKTLIFGLGGSLDEPKYTETGGMQRYGTVETTAYPAGVQFVYGQVTGYRVINLANGQELPVLAN